MWEYLVEQLDGDNNLQAYLTEAGEQGWELVHYHYVPGMLGQPARPPVSVGVGPIRPGQPAIAEVKPAHQLILKRPISG